MTQYTYKLPSQLLKAVNEERCVLFLGAGASLAAGLPSGRELANLLADELRVDFENEQKLDKLEELTEARRSLKRISQLYNSHYSTGARAQQKIAALLADRERSARKEVLEPIRTISKIRQILTTNYDTLVEDMFGATDCRVIYRPEDLRQSTGPAVELIKLHGTRTDFKSMVLTEEDYLVYSKTHAALVDLTKTSLRKHIVVMVGFSQEDENIGTIYHDAGIEPDVINYFVSPSASLFQELYWTKRGFQHVPLTAEEFFQYLKDDFDASNYREDAVSIPDRTPALTGSRPKANPLSNPFVLYDTEALIEQKPELLFETFVPPVRFPTLLEHQTTFIEGHRGSGKSTVLWRLSIKANAYSQDTELPMWGFFIKMVPGWFTDFRRAVDKDGNWTEPDAGWVKYFTHYFNLLVLTGILQNLQDAFDLKIFTANERLPSVLNRIATKLLRLDDLIEDIEDLEHLKMRVEEEIDTAVNSRAQLPFYSTNTFINRTLGLLSLAIPEMKHRSWHILLDEYDNVYPEQQEVINIILRERNQRIRFKIAVKTLHAHLNDVYGKKLDHIDDYGYLSCDSNMWDQILKPQYITFLEDLSQQRLKLAGYEGVEIRTLLPGTDNEKYYAGFESFCYLSSGLTRRYLQLCKDAVYEAYPDTASRKVDLRPIPITTQNHVAKIHSAILFTAYRGTPQPQRVYRLLTLFGTLFRAIAMVTMEQKEYRTPLSFELSELDVLTGESLDVLEQAVKAGLLQIPTLPKQPQNPIRDSPAQKYSFHRLLAPFFNLPLTERYPEPVTAKQFNSIWEHPTRVLQALSKGYRSKGIKKYLDDDLPLFGGI